MQYRDRKQTEKTMSDKPRVVLVKYAPGRVGAAACWIIRMGGGGITKNIQPAVGGHYNNIQPATIFHSIC